MTSPPCRCNWGKIHGETDNPAKIWNKSPANRQDIASANLGNQTGQVTCSLQAPVVFFIGQQNSPSRNPMGMLSEIR
jgi:hypothetical protein